MLSGPRAFYDQYRKRLLIKQRLPCEEGSNASSQDILSTLRKVESHDHPSVTEGTKDHAKRLSERSRRRQEDEGSRFELYRLKTTRETARASGAATFEHERIRVHAA